MIAVLAILGFASRGLQPFIPAPAPGNWAAARGDFFRQTAGQKIRWQDVTADSFAEAQRRDRPILLIVGRSWSQTGRQLDRTVFAAGEVQNFLRSNFVCIRIDADRMPAWAAAFLPLSRVALGVAHDHQMWVMDAQGTLVDFLSQRRPAPQYDRNSFLQKLINARTAFVQWRQSGVLPDLATRHLADIAAIEQSIGGFMPNSREFDVSIVSAIGEDGSFPALGYQNLMPSAYRYLAARGIDEPLSRALMPVLRSPLVDLRRGGFFQRSRSEGWRRIEFDKSAVQNAEMVHALALASSHLTSSDAEIALFLADRTQRMLLSQFSREDGLFHTAQLGDENEYGRSRGSSITPREIRNFIPSRGRDTFRERFGLNVESNPQMVPMLAQGDATGLDQLTEVYQDPPEPTFTGIPSMSVNGVVIARLLEAARANDDDPAIRELGLRMERLDAFRDGDNVQHDLQGGTQSVQSLSDYLAYADAALQDYLATGRVVSLENGLSVLRRGLAMYAAGSPGVYRLRLPLEDDPGGWAGPEIADSPSESATATVIRLTTCYGRLYLGSGGSAIGQELLSTAFAATRAFSAVSGQLGAHSAGYAHSALALADDAFALCVGPDAQVLANRLYRLRPTRLVAPVFGPVWPELADRSPGVYVVLNGRLSGPVAVPVAARLLPLRLGP